MRWGLVLLTALGCRQVLGLEPPAQREIDAAELDAPPDGPLTCSERWRYGPTFSTPVIVAPAGSNANDSDPYTTSNELELYWSRDNQIRVATRNARTDPFTTSTMSTLDSGTGDSKSTVLGNTAFVASSRAISVGGADIWHAARASPADAWVVDQTYMGSVNTTGNDLDPHLSSDGLRLYLAPIDNNAQTLRVATRVSMFTNWGTPTVITELDGGGNEGDPSLTGDELVIVYSTVNTTRDLYYATRSSTAQPFGAPLPISALNTTNLSEGGAHVTSDGCELYFETNSGGDLDIYVVSVTGP